MKERMTSMKKLNLQLLSFVTGGYCSYCRVPAKVLASIAQVSANPRDAAPNNVEHSDAVSHYIQYSHENVNPKNGDRNAQWQQFSWGTWWDDTN